MAAVPCELSKIMIAETSDYHVIWLREKTGACRDFPILIGLFEAVAIDRKIREVETPRPLTHDLLANTISTLAGELEKVVVTELKNNTFYASLVIRQNGHVVEVDSRPSDAIALAVRLETPIFVEEAVIDQVTSWQDQGDEGLV
ncbi:MAG: bifunctional nuclease family protein [Planctomycetota bacterium]|nr:bifunctional nuclease family protein [Planctomycetota bacterium]MDA1139634.1 bifunctional nuclease family protein [Planctomycetota bacterium]